MDSGKQWRTAIYVFAVVEALVMALAIYKVLTR